MQKYEPFMKLITITRVANISLICFIFFNNDSQDVSIADTTNKCLLIKI